jgi:hypothetical protein
MSKVRLYPRSSGFALVLHLPTGHVNLNQVEVEELITELLATQTHFPNIVKAIWAQRTAPHGEIVRYYRHVGSGIVDMAGHRCFVLLGTHELLVSDLFQFSEAAVADAKAKYGSDFPILPNIRDDLVSKEQAEHEATMEAAAEYCKQHNITLKQLMTQIKTNNG